ncbi:MAG: hypothetical protein WBV94_04065 [Blastocatellia bacterium]
MIESTNDITDEILEQSTPRFTIDGMDNYPALIFNQTGNMTEHRPTIFALINGSWALFDLGSSGLEQSDWVHVAATRDRKYAWGITQINVEGAGPTLEIVFSEDGGKSWAHVASIDKPVFLAAFSSFRMTSSGNGRLTVHLEDSSDPKIEDGYYTYSTSDWGKSWTKKPVYSPDALTAAIPQQFDEPPGATKLKEIMKDLSGR